MIASAFWRRLDTVGHDVAFLERAGEGWRVKGAAVFQHGDAPARLSYEVDCDAGWRTLRGEVRGWLAGEPVEWVAERGAGGVWTLNGAAAPGLERCEDLDLGFTPATNLQQLRRVGLAVGQSAEVPVAWLDVEAGARTLVVLPQRYERRSADTFWYESPGYQGLLEVDDVGFIRRYPGLWEAE